MSCANIPGGKVPGLCPIPQVFEKEDEPNRNLTWIRLLRHETGRPLHVQVRRSGLHRRRRSRILSAVRNSCWLFTLAHALFAYRSKWKSRKAYVHCRQKCITTMTLRSLIAHHCNVLLTLKLTSSDRVKRMSKP